MKLSYRQLLVITFILVFLLVTSMILAVVFGVQATWRPPRGEKEGGKAGPKLPYSGSSLGKYRFAAVAADAADCSPIGVEIMAKHGGSAVDAAIAAMVCVGVLNIHSTGIGGGHFMVVYDTPNGGTQKEMKAIDAREAAPLEAEKDMYNKSNFTDASVKGGLAIGVPGEISGFYEAWKRYGRLPWRTLFEPSIKLCEQGHVIVPNLATNIKKSEKLIREEPNLRALFVKANNELYKEGDIIKRPLMAETLRRIAEDPMAFYNGSLAEDIAADIQEYKGIVRKADLERYKAKVKDAVSTMMSDEHTAYSPPAPSGGPILNYILNILRGYKFTSDALSTKDKKILTYHRVVEAFKHGYAKRSLLGDEDFVDLKELVQNLTSQNFGEMIRAQIQDDRTLPEVKSYNPGFLSSMDTHGTAHLSVLGPDGSAVSVTGSINHYFGSKVRGSRTGIMFNNEMDDFSTPGAVNAFGIPASPSNYIAPEKRPQSSMSPVIVMDRDGNVVFLTGGAGGSRITSITAFVTMHTLWFGLPLLDAVDTPRFHHQLVPNKVFYEKGFPQDLIDGLKAKGHVLEEYHRNIANVHSVHDKCAACGDTCGKTPCIDAVTDIRKPSLPDGF